MDTKDLRSVYDIVNDVQAVARVLQTYPPPSTDLWNTSGLDCLVTVLRHIYSLVAIGPYGIAQDPEHLAAERTNPILMYAWTQFKRPISAEAIRNAGHAKAAVMNKVRDLTGNHLHTITFEGLCMSKLMDNTFWCRPHFQLFTALQFKADTCEWLPVTWSARDKARNSILRLDLSEKPGMTLQRLIDNTYGLRRIHGVETLCLHNTPLIIRVVFTPGLGRMPSLFSTIRHFNIPMHAGLEPHERVNYVFAPAVNYGLLAVVRLRAGPRDDDLIRTYGPGGDYIVPEYEPGGYMASTWSVDEHDGARYMLFFGASDQSRADPTRPEVITQPPMNVLPVTHFGNQSTRVPSLRPLNPSAPEFRPQNLHRPSPWNANHAPRPTPGGLPTVQEAPTAFAPVSYGQVQQQQVDAVAARMSRPHYEAEMRRAERGEAVRQHYASRLQTLENIIAQATHRRSGQQ
ncbi:hypothetical protein QQX98_006907 [Neonectria punicea]|uniref:Uncharacterized protein n=1 Tax=Neonectria punicea TaxID=979145 RepID=A0ABR1H004_9HYPO